MELETWVSCCSSSMKELFASEEKALSPTLRTV